MDMYKRKTINELGKQIEQGYLKQGEHFSNLKETKGNNRASGDTDQQEADLLYVY